MLKQAPSRLQKVRNKSRFTSFNIAATTVGILLVSIVTLPLLQLLFRMFWVDGQLSLTVVTDTLSYPKLGSLLLDTVVLVLASSVLAVVIGSMLAWVNIRTDARFGFLNDIFPYLPFLLPPVAGAIGWTMLLSPRAGLVNVQIREALAFVGINIDEGPFNINSWYGLIGVFTIYAVPYVYQNVAARLVTFDASLEEASRISGASYTKTLFAVTLPAIAPSLGASFMLCVWFGFGMFSIASIIGVPAGIDNLAVEIVQLLTFSYPANQEVALGLSAFVLLFVGISYYLQLRILKKGQFAAISGKSTKSAPIRLGRWRTPIRGLVLTYIVLTTILPMAGMVIVALHGYWTADINFGQFSFDAFRTVLFEDTATQSAIINSLSLGIIGATIGMLAATLVAIYVSKNRSLFTRGMDLGIKLPASISNMIIAVGILILLGGSPFELRGTLLILLIGYVALYLPQASIAADAAVSTIGRELDEASNISGAGGWKTLFRIYMPLMLPGLVGGWALLFVRMVGDLSASAILAGTTNNVIGFRILEVFNGGSYATLAALGTILVVVSAVVVGTALFISKKFGIESVNNNS